MLDIMHLLDLVLLVGSVSTRTAHWLIPDRTA